MIPRRRGYTLIECLVAITLLGSLLGTVTLTLTVMYRAERTMRDALDQQRSLEQFTARFRSDAHQASSASVSKPAEANGPARELVLECATDQMITYTLRPQAVERVVRRGESTVHRETYGLTAASARWEVREQKTPIVSLLLDGQTRIDAVVHLLRKPP